jgi:hypothetical protein
MNSVDIMIMLKLELTSTMSLPLNEDTQESICTKTIDWISNLKVISPVRLSFEQLIGNSTSVFKTLRKVLREH